MYSLHEVIQVLTLKTQIEMSTVKKILAKDSVEVEAEAKESRNESASRPNMTTQFNSALFANVMEW